MSYPGYLESPKNIHILGHLAAARARVLRTLGRSETGASAMRIIPLHLQRRFEQRWAARFGSLVIPAAPKNARLKGSPVNMPRARQKPKKNPPG